MTLRPILALTLLVLAPAGAALAQDPGTALEACRALGETNLRNDAPGTPSLVIDRDRHLFLQPREDKIGSQPLGVLLTGNGAVVYETTPGVEFSFVCLLADEKRALFFYWLPRGSEASALAQCTRSERLRADPSECLASLRSLNEADMLHISAERFYEARQRDFAAGNNATTIALTESGNLWHAYREAECARQRVAAPKATAEAVHGACLAELARQRGMVLRAR